MNKNNFYGNKEFIAIDSLRIPEYYQKEDIEDQIDVLRNGIEKFGIKSPLIVNESVERFNTIIHGVLIYELAKQFGINEVPVYYLDLTAQEEKELSVLLNQRGRAQLSKEEIIQLLGTLSYDSFFNSQVQSTILKKHFQSSKNNISTPNNSEKKLIKQLIFRISETEKMQFDNICKELEVNNQSQALQMLMEFYLKNK